MPGILFEIANLFKLEHKSLNELFTVDRDRELYYKFIGLIKSLIMD